MRPHTPDENLNGTALSLARVLGEEASRAAEQARVSGRLARIVAGAAAAHRRPRWAGRPRLAWGALALVFAGSSVFAALWVAPRLSTVPGPRALPGSSVRPVFRPRVVPIAAPEKVTPPARKPVAVAVAQEDASALFAQGNEARRAGRYADSERLYRLLQRRFPDAPEANISRVALGRLLLDRSQQLPMALRLFDEYLATAPQGSLVEQALAGRALAFKKLGRAREERQAWQVLLLRYPDSAHATEARARIHVFTK